MGKLRIDLVCSKCGKEFEHVAFKRGKEAADYEEWARKNITICPECYRKMQEDQRAAEAQKAASENKDHGFAELKGSPKQIEWAEKIRASFMSKFDDLGVIDKKHPIYVVFAEVIGGIDSAHTWIESNEMHPSRVYAYAHERFDEIMDGEAKLEDFRSPNTLVYALLEAALKKSGSDVSATDILEPEESKHQSLAEVVVSEEKVSVKSPKDQSLIDLVKGAGYKWNPDTREWVLNIDYKTGSSSDRAADIANKLLREGFSVKLPSELKAKAVNADFEPMASRWISSIKDSGDSYVYIQWGKDEPEMYELAMKLPKAKEWNHGKYVRVPISAHSEIRDFADIYGFHFSPGAEKKLIGYEEKVVVVSPVKPSEAPKVDKSSQIEDILNSGNEIIEDLKDD